MTGEKVDSMFDLSKAITEKIFVKSRVSFPGNLQNIITKTIIGFYDVLLIPRADGVDIKSKKWQLIIRLPSGVLAVGPDFKV